MIKIRIILTFMLLSLFTAHANELKPKKENNTSSFKLVKVNNHTITSKILGPKKVNALLHKFTNSERKNIIEQLINDEIGIQYALQYLKLDDNLSDEKKRLDFGIKQINEIALQECIKSISDKNASAIYKQHKKLYWHEKHYEASHIMLTDKNTTIEVLDLLKKSSDINSSFQELAKKYSKDRSSKNGGYLGHFESKIMVKEFKEALENLKVGQYTTKGVRTRFGYHIILLHSIKPKGYFSFSEVKDQIKEKMAKSIKNQWFQKTLLPLKKKANIKYIFDVNGTY